MLIQSKAPDKPTLQRSTDEGFGTLGEFLQAVAEHSKTGGGALGVLHPRLEASVTGLGETFPSIGGFLVQNELARQMIMRVYDTGRVASRVQRLPLAKSNSSGLKINTLDEDSRADGSRWGGAQAYWAKEADAATGTTPKFRQIQLELQKLIGLCYVTDELLEDSGALDIVVSRVFTEEILFKLEDSIFNGSGVGEPLGIVYSAATYTVEADSGDVGATISAKDVLNMWSHLWPPSRQDAAWFVNSDVEPQLYPLALGSATAANLLYTPPGQSGSRFGLLLGCPVIPVEYCAALGTPGDIVLADLGEYALIDKGTPTKSYSIHVNFLTDENVFRFVYRVDGQPTWKKPLTPKYGTNQQAPFVMLSARS
jgi:HK97 family phage major capsid protein